MKPPESFETDRLRLRRSVIEDAEAIFTEYAQDLEVTTYLTWRPSGKIEDTREHLRASAEAWREGTAFGWVILRKNDDQLLGAVGVRVDGHKVELGSVVSDRFWSPQFKA